MPSRHHILGLAAFYHDAAAALRVDGNITAAAQEERFTRKKNDAEFPAQPVSCCLQPAKITPAQIDAVVCYDQPVLTLRSKSAVFQRLERSALLDKSVTTQTS